MKKNTLVLIIILTAGAVFITALQLFILPNQSKEAPSQATPSPIQTERPSLSPSPTKQYRSTKEKLVNLLPIQKESFTMEYLASEDSFIVLIKTADLNAGKEETITWLKEQGIYDWEELDIIWGGGRRF